MRRPGYLGNLEDAWFGLGGRSKTGHMKSDWTGSPSPPPPPPTTTAQVLTDEQLRAKGWYLGDETAGANKGKWCKITPAMQVCYSREMVPQSWEWLAG